MKYSIVSIAISLPLGVRLALPVHAQEVLPFPPKPSASLDGRTMQESIYSPLPAVNRLPKDAPNILIVLIDDVGPAQADTYGGEIHPPTLSKIATGGISYNRFHTADLKEMFLIEFTRNRGLPVGGGLWVPVFHPEL